MRGFPQDPSLEATLALLREGYGFVSRRFLALRSDVFRTRLMLRPPGAEAEVEARAPGAGQ